MTILGDIMERLCASTLESRKRLQELVDALPQPPEDGWGDRWTSQSAALFSATLEELQTLHQRLESISTTDNADSTCEAAFVALKRRKRCAQLARDTAMRQTREYDRACMV